MVQVRRILSPILLVAAVLAVGGVAWGWEVFDPRPRDLGLFDLILRNSDDPDLLTGREALLRQKLLDMGVDPLHPSQSPSIGSLYRRWLADGVGLPLFEPARQVEILEPLPGTERLALYRFPETFLFYTDPDTNLVGVVFEPPRPVDDPTVEVQIVSAEGWLRTWRAVALSDEWRRSLARRVAAQQADDGLLNFTLPIKLPRTLERIIGKGEATSIRISGQERISISGQSTIRDNFLGSEVNQSQSLFPTLEMQQNLRVNLDGQVGEKIKVRVSHDSEAFGNQATEVKLSFEGDEDDIIRTIRAGDIDVTLPGSRLLGIQAQRGGLFGVKIEGALGPLDFTLLTSKEQSQQGKRSFTASGGAEQEFVVKSTEYVKNRIFRLTAPFPLFFPVGTSVDSNTVQVPLQDQSATWDPNWRIDLSTLNLYVSLAPGLVPGDRAEILDVYPGRAYIEETGYYWGYQGGAPDPDAEPFFSPARRSFVESSRWRRLGAEEWRPILEAETGQLIGVLLSSELPTEIALGVTYDVVDAAGARVLRVGRDWLAGEEPPLNPDPGADSERIYYFKLIKPAEETAPTVPADPGQVPYWDHQNTFDLAWEYMYRNYYFLRGVGIDPTTLDVQMRLTGDTRAPESAIFENLAPGVDREARRWINVFGLDTENTNGEQVPGGDGIIDLDEGLVYPELGLLQFPRAKPFDADYITDENGGTRAPELYTDVLSRTEVDQKAYYELLIKHASTSSRLSLGTFNVKEGSEEVRLDGRLLARGVDYEIDYFSGEITLTGAAGELNAQTNITVDFEVDPLFGGGRTSLNGLNLGYRLGRNKTLSTTWLLQSKPTSNRKPRLGEEPTKDWVGNLSAKLQFEPAWVTDVANLLPRVQSTEASRVSVDAEVAVSIPNPNTRGSAYLDDFEAVDRSDVLPMGREGWWWASLPADYGDGGAERRFGPEDRAYIRWYRPTPGLLREDLNPELSEQERRDVVPALHLQMEPDPADPAAPWSEESYTGIMRGFASDLDLSEAQFLEFWVNDFAPEPNDREGILHFDFGFINEDFQWKTEVDAQGNIVSYEQGQFDQEDQDNDGQVSELEDTGLDGLLNSQESLPPRPPFQGVPGEARDPAGDDFEADKVNDDSPFPRINGLEGNRRSDSEDINRNGFFDRADGYFSITVDLRSEENVLVDVLKDFYDGGATYDPDDEAKADWAWRKYRLDLRDLETHLARAGEIYNAKSPDLRQIRYFRIWYEVPGGSTRARRDLQFAEMRFLGNRWIADGIHDSQTHERLLPESQAPADFRVGVLNNKDNPVDYIPPVFPDTRNNVAEKEQSLQLSYTDLGPGQEIRVRREVPGSQGQDFLQYNQLKFFWRAPLETYNPPVLAEEQQGLVPFYWVGTDSLNYYEISFPFDQVEVDGAGWVEVRIRIDEMTNLKINDDLAEDVVLPNGRPARKARLKDVESNNYYDVLIVGRPDLRRVRRYYAGLRYPRVVDGTGQPAGPLVTGDVLFNELRLAEVNKKTGLAKQLSLTANIPGLMDISGSFSETDAEFRGLNRETGSGAVNRDWQIRGSSKLQNLVPTFGLDVPFSASATRRSARPKYAPSTDIVLLNEAQKDSLSTEDGSESFNFQVRRQGASRNKLLAYSLDRLSYSYSVTRSRQRSPQRNVRRYSDKSQYNYDLNFTSGFTFRFPFIGYQFRYMPNQLTLSSIWSRDITEQTTKLENAPPQQTFTEQRSVRNNGSLSWTPTRNIRLAFSVASTRDPNRRREKTDEEGRVLTDEAGRPLTEPVEWLGINWGLENAHTERFNANYTPLVPVIKWFKPDLTFTGSYSENRGVQVRRSRVETVIDPDTGDERQVTVYTDPPGTRHLSNSNDLQIRGEIDLGGAMKKILGSGRAETSRRRPAAEERRQRGRLDRRGRGRSVTPEPATPPEPTPAPSDTTGAGGEQEEGAPGDQRDRSGGRGAPPPEDPFAQRQEPPPEEVQPPAPEEEEYLPPEEEDQEEPPAEGEEGEGEEAFDPKAAAGALVRPVVTFLREFQPVRVSWNFRNNSGYQHMVDRASWAYRLGYAMEPGVAGADSVFNEDGEFVGTRPSSSTLNHDNRLSISTQSRLSKDIRVDLSYAEDYSRREGSLQSQSKDFSREWPVVSVNVQNVHKWRLFGDALANSTLDYSYRKTQSWRGITPTNPGTPRTTVSHQPRWNFRLKSDLSGNINVNLTTDESVSAGKTNRTERAGVNVQFTKSFDAQGALGFLRFGKRGTGSSIDMTLDIAWDKRQSFRILADGAEDQRTGNETISVRPRFSYQFSRSLTAGLELSYSRTKDLGNSLNGQKSFGLGLNATFTF